MILYLDTSALVKLYVDEDGSEQQRETAERSEAVVVSWISYVEARSAFSRVHREGKVSSSQYQERLNDFEKDWPDFSAIEVSIDIIRSAGDLVEKHGLRALDAIQLASGLKLRDDYAVSPGSVIFSSADTRLLLAARAEGFSTSPLM